MKILSGCMLIVLALLMVCVGLELSCGRAHPQFRSYPEPEPPRAEPPLKQGLGPGVVYGFKGRLFDPENGVPWTVAPIGSVRLESEELAGRGRDASGKLVQRIPGDRGVLQGESLTYGTRRVTLYDDGYSSMYGESYCALMSELDEQGQWVVMAFGRWATDELKGGWCPVAELDMTRGEFDGKPGIEFRHLLAEGGSESSFFGLEGEEAKWRGSHTVRRMRLMMELE